MYVMQQQFTEILYNKVQSYMCIGSCYCSNLSQYLQPRLFLQLWLFCISLFTKCCCWNLHVAANKYLDKYTCVKKTHRM